MRRLLVLALAAVAAAGLRAADYSRELAEVKSGQRSEAKASWWGFDRENATRCLQEALDSGVKKLIIDNTGSEWILDPVEIPGNIEIVLAKGVVLSARKGGFKHIRDSLLSAYGRVNITIRGEEGAVIRMHKKDYQDKSQYKFSEWRHAISLWGCDSVVIRDLTIKSSGGDGIYVGSKWFDKLRGEETKLKSPLTRTEEYCSNVLIENVICDDHHRQGISVISARNLIIRKCVLKNTSGTAPAAGIDFEPNRANEILENCIMEDCLVEDNSGGGILVATEINTPIDLIIRRCTITGGSRGISLTPPSDRKRTNPGTVVIEDCIIRETGNSGIVIGNHLAKFYKIIVKNTQLIDSGKDRGITPISFTYNRPTQGMVGNTAFDNVQVKTIPGRRLIAFKNWTPNTWLGEVTGMLIVDGKKVDVAQYIHEQGFDQPTDYKSREIDAAKLCPAAAKPVATRIILNLRQHVNILIWGEAGKELKFELRGRDTKRRPRELAVKLVKPDGSGEVLGTMTPGENKEFSFTPEKTGAYMLDLNIGLHMLYFKPLTPMHWAVKSAAGTDGYVSFFKPRGKGTPIYFAVPAGQKEFKVEVTGYPGETVSAEIKSPDGKSVEKRVDFDGPEVFTVKRDGDGAEIWSIVLTNAVEDVQMRLIEPLPPLFTTHAPNLLIEK